MNAPLLQVEGLSKRFGGLVAVKDVTFEVAAGEITGVLGPNGAGKTTLMRCISDGHERSAGRVVVAGHDIDHVGPERCVRFGLGRKFQTANVFETLTVAECLRLARLRHERPSVLGSDAELHLPAAAIRVIEATRLHEHLTEEVRHLSHGLKQALELAMVLALEPRVILLDEPTAGLTKPERSMIGTILVDLTREEGLCVLLVEHDLDFVRDISSRVIVLHQGRIVLDGSVAEVVSSPLVKTIYAGEETGLQAESRP